MDKVKFTVDITILQDSPPLVNVTSKLGDQVNNLLADKFRENLFKTNQ